MAIRSTSGISVSVCQTVTGACAGNLGQRRDHVAVAVEAREEDDG